MVDGETTRFTDAREDDCDVLVAVPMAPVRDAVEGLIEPAQHDLVAFQHRWWLILVRVAQEVAERSRLQPDVAQVAQRRLIPLGDSETCGVDPASDRAGEHVDADTDVEELEELPVARTDGLSLIHLWRNLGPVQLTGCLDHMGDLAGHSPIQIAKLTPPTMVTASRTS